jgi:hypothetical protein
MAAKNKRRKLPEEDLVSAVADIINSPITRTNLSFLRFPAETAVTKEGEHPATAKEAAASTPMGLGSTPVGVSQKPQGFDATPTEDGLKPIGYGQDVAPPPLRNGSLPNSLPYSIRTLEPERRRPLWQAENLDAIFEQSRVHRIERAQDALSLTEESVYDLLWGPRNLKRDEYRLVHCSLQRITVEARINIKTVRELIPRLIEKGFLDIEHPADPRRNTPTLYRVWSYSSVLARQRERRRFYVVKTGKGVFYVRPMDVALTPSAFPSPIGVESNPMGLTPLGDDSQPMENEQSPLGGAPIPPMEAGSLKPMGSGGRLSIGIQKGTFVSQTTTTTYGALIQALRGMLGVEPDSALINATIADCHKRAIETTGEPATDEELLYFAKSKARVLAASPNIRNHLAVLRRALPECFSGEAFRIFRAASQKSAEPKEPALDPEEEKLRAAELELWAKVSERHLTPAGYDIKAIAEDPALSEKGRRIARQILKTLGPYTPNGLLV